MIKHTILMIARILLALILITVGLIGLIAPIMPGWILIIPGVALISRDLFATCQKSRIRIVRESACRLSGVMNLDMFRRMIDKIRRSSKRKI